MNWIHYYTSTIKIRFFCKIDMLKYQQSKHCHKLRSLNSNFILLSNRIIHLNNFKSNNTFRSRSFLKTSNLTLKLNTFSEFSTSEGSLFQNGK